jgi:6-phosphogluconolactonase
LFFHPSKPFAYLLNELSNSVLLLEINSDGTLKESQRLSTLPKDFIAHSQAAHLYVSNSGKNLYVSNRGHQSIAVYGLADDGKMTLLQIEPTQGDWPRDFAVLESADTLLVANQRSHNIVTFKIAADGTLAATGEQIKLPQTTFLGELK